MPEQDAYAVERTRLLEAFGKRQRAERERRNVSPMSTERTSVPGAARTALVDAADPRGRAEGPTGRPARRPARTTGARAPESFRVAALDQRSGVMAEKLHLVAFGRAVRQMREQHGLSVETVAVAAKLALGELEAIEAGRMVPGYYDLLYIPAALGITPTELLLRVERNGSDLDPRAVSVAFGQRLRELRTERGISQESLAHRTGLHTTAIGRMERGAREPRATMILRLAQGLEVLPAALLDGLEVTGCLSSRATARTPR